LQDRHTVVQIPVNVHERKVQLRAWWLERLEHSWVKQRRHAAILIIVTWYGVVTSQCRPVDVAPRKVHLDEMANLVIILWAAGAAEQADEWKEGAEYIISSENKCEVDD
jgi:hypothetical protein